MDTISRNYVFHVNYVEMPIVQGESHVYFRGTSRVAGVCVFEK